MQAYRPGHRLPVYSVRWNGLHSRTFLSAGADWKVKLWDSVLPKVRHLLQMRLKAAAADTAAAVPCMLQCVGRQHILLFPATAPTAAACAEL